VSWPDGLPAERLPLGTILRCRVVDAEGRHLGRVYDVVARRDGPLLNEAAGLSWTVRELVVSRKGLVERLGLASHRPTTPRLLGRLSTGQHRVSWDEVESYTSRTLRLSVPRARLRSADPDR